MDVLSDGSIVATNIELLILDYINTAFLKELEGKLEDIRFPYSTVKQMSEYKTWNEIETLAHAALDYYLYINPKDDEEEDY